MLIEALRHEGRRQGYHSNVADLSGNCNKCLKAYHVFLTTPPYCVQELMRNGHDEASGASLNLPPAESYDALDRWAFNSYEEMKVHISLLHVSL